MCERVRNVESSAHSGRGLVIFRGFNGLSEEGGEESNHTLNPMQMAQFGCP